MPKLSELNLTEAAAPQVDWDAPEAGQTPPPIFPGSYRFTFKLPESRDDWFDTQEVEAVKGNPTTKQKFLVIRHTPLINTQLQADGSELPVPGNDDGSPKQLPTQKASFFMSGKMLISRGAEMLRSMGVRLEGDLLSKIEPTIEQLNGKASFVGVVIWRAYFQSTSTTVSTSPRKKQGELPWPRKIDGTPELLAVNPQTGEKAYGYPEINSYKMQHPAAATGATS